jgi:hypothetical protein
VGHLGTCCAILADLTRLWALWPAVVDNHSKLTWPQPWRHKRLAAATLVAIGLAFTAATFPGESIDERIELLNPDISGREGNARVSPHKENGDESTYESAYQKSLADQLKSLICYPPL